MCIFLLYIYTFFVCFILTFCCHIYALLSYGFYKLQFLNFGLGIN